MWLGWDLGAYLYRALEKTENVIWCLNFFFETPPHSPLENRRRTTKLKDGMYVVGCVLSTPL